MPASSWDERLVSQIAGRDGQPPTIMEVARPQRGHVRVREWPDGEWSLPARETEPSCDELLARLERARTEARHVSEDEHRVRAWLEGRA
ncbi:MAG: hypothetical protein ACT4PJ_10965 [Gemmatimonadaceae bacterium]